MSCEVRRVPAHWQHPRNGAGHHIPLHGRNFRKEAAKWDEGNRKWQEGDYMPNWSESERTHYQMYEVVTEGTPISPVMATPEELACWLVENGVEHIPGKQLPYDVWLAFIKGDLTTGVGCLIIKISTRI